MTARKQKKGPDVQEVPKKARPDRKRSRSHKGSSAVVTASQTKKVKLEEKQTTVEPELANPWGLLEEYKGNTVTAKSPDTPPTESASSSRALSAVAGAGGGVGNLACVYTYVGPDADVNVVAQDLRKHGPTILLMCCESEEKASSMRHQLELPAKSAVAEPKTQPASHTSRRPCSRPEIQYKCVQFGQLVVGGRAGIVTTVTVVEELYLKFTCDPEFPALIAEVAFSVSICELTSIRVAVAERTGNTKEDYVPKLVGLLESSRVRLLGCVSERAITDLAVALRTKLTANVAAWQPHRATQGNKLREEVLSHYMFVIGPVCLVEVAYRERHSLECFTRGDEAGLCIPRELLLPETPDPWKSLLDFLSPNDGLVPAYPRKGFGLPVLPRVNQKIVQYMAPHTVKLQVFCGGRESRRTVKKAQERTKKTQLRAERWSAEGANWPKRFHAHKHAFGDHK